MTELRLDSITKTFGQTVALDDFSLEIASGELVSLLGPSGCGKTTALRIIAGFEHQNGGAVLVGGLDISPIPAHRRNMGMVFQSYSLFPNMNVRQNIEFGLRTRRVSAAERTKRVNEAIELVQLEQQASRFSHQLSGGQQQRVALARALAIRPDVLLLDEPLSALDAKVRAVLREEIRRIQRESGITTVFVTHDQDEALSISDRVAVMSEGRLEQMGSPEAVYSSPTTGFVAKFVGTINEIPAVFDNGRIRIGSESFVAPHLESARSTVKVLIRPEFVELSDVGVGAIVVQNLFMGSHRYIDARLEDGSTIVRVQRPTEKSNHEVGSKVNLRFDASRMLIDQ